VQYISDRVLVMYLGQVVEIGPVDEIYGNPLHPYAKALLASRLAMDPRERIEESPIAGDPPNPIDPPSGCRFRTRCPFADPICETSMPSLTGGGDGAHLVACHMAVPDSGHSQAGGLAVH
jgi:peptide/nickel transport system ATP-binding protein